MKRLATSLGICSVLLLFSAVYANDFTWTGNAFPTTTLIWHDVDNWGGVAFPGNGTRTFDRAIIDAGPDNPEVVTFTGASGDGTHGLQNRMISSLVLDAKTNSQPIRLEIRNDELYVGRLLVLTDTSDDVEIEVWSNGVFRARNVNIDSTLGITTLDFRADVEFGRTVLMGEVKIDIAAGMTFDAGQLIIQGEADGETVVEMTNATPGDGLFHSS